MYQPSIKKEINCRTTALIIKYIKAYIPQAYPALKKIIEKSEYEEMYLTKEGHWVSFKFVNMIYDLVYEYTRNPFIMYDIAQKTDELMPTSIPVLIFKSFRSPLFAFRQTSRFADLYERISRVNLLDTGRNYVIIEEEFTGYHQTWHSFQYGRGIFAGIPRVCGKELVSAEMMECSFSLAATPFFKDNFRVVGDYICDIEGNRMAHKDSPVKYRGTLYNAKNDIHKIVWHMPPRKLFFISKRKIEYESLLKRLEENTRLIEEKERLINELSLARRLQEVYLSKNPPAIPGWDIAYISQPMIGVSGDFYDFYEQDNTLLGVSIFDVSGHGISSALLTMLGKSIVYRNFMNGLSLNLGVMMDAINTELTGELYGIGHYFTGLILRFVEGRVEYVNAAHPPFYHYSRRTNRCTEIDTISGTLLGIDSITFHYETTEIIVDEGDVVVLITDGITDAENNIGIPYPHDRLCLVIESNADNPAQAIATSIMDDFYSYIGRRDELPDDATLVVLKKQMV